MEKPLLPVRILLVEDDPNDIEITIRALEEGGIKNELTVARDGEEALKSLRAGKGKLPGLVLLDLNLPKKNGHEVLKEIKADRTLKLIPVVILTASTREEDVVRSYDLGVSTFITKPVEFVKFMDVVRAIENYWILIASLPRIPERVR